jgi:hypothetical protein
MRKKSLYLRKSSIALAALLFTLLLFVNSCDLPEAPNAGTRTGANSITETGPETGGASEAGRGTLTLILPKTRASKTVGGTAASRSVLSDAFIGDLKYRITATDASGGTVVAEAGEGGATTISLKAGPWTIAAEAYVEDAPTVTVGSGSVSVTIVAGENAQKTISMYVDPDYEDALEDIYIHNEAELRRIGAEEDGLSIDDPDRTFYLVNDIELTGSWTPIGFSDDAFKAVFDGQGKTITIKGFDASEGRLGLFGYTDGATVKDLKVECSLGDSGDPLEFSEISHAGAVAGFAGGGSVFENIIVSGSFRISVTYSDPVDGLSFGGIAGINDDGFIRSCRVNAVFSVEAGEGADDFYIGGVAGENRSGSEGGIIEKSSFTGNLTGNGLHSIYAGGITGRSDGTSSSITGSYTAGAVEGVVTGGSSYHSYVGGIAGSSDGTIANCYAWADVSSGSDYQEWAGGIAGDGGGTISKCYAAGTVQGKGSGSPYIGGILGQGTGVSGCMVLVEKLDGGPSTSSSLTVYAIGAGGTFSGNYSLIDITYDNYTNPDFDFGINAQGGLRKPLDDFKSAALYTGWNFTAETGDWKWLTESDYDYPVLSWQQAAPLSPEEASRGGAEIEIEWP